jgi:ParB family transcriptional regulator, chromosome partitioning protein
LADLLTSITELPVADIEMGPRLRPVSRAGVEALKSSIGELGVMKDAVHVRKIKRTGALVLMAGAHRLTAARELGWATIPAKVWSCTDDWAALMEIDDNLASSELTALDTAVFLAARKRVYEKLHPETKAGTAGALAKHGLATDIMSFAETTAEKFGLSSRHVRRLVTVGSFLNQDDIRWLRAAPRPVTLADLQCLAKIPDAEERAQVCIALTNGKAKSAAKARAALIPGKTTVQDPVEAAFKALRDAWLRAPKAARRRFVETEIEVLEDLLIEARTVDA